MPDSAKPYGQTYGLVGVFDKPSQIYAACEALRDAGYKNFDALTPFPVHGLERAMGLKPSIMPWISLIGAFTGCGCAYLLQWWVNLYALPLVIAGKPFDAYQAFVPICFEWTILFSAIFTFWGMWIINGLPRPHHPTMHHPSFPRATDDGFLIAVEVTDPKYDAVATRKLLEDAGAQEIQEVSE